MFLKKYKNLPMTLLISSILASVKDLPRTLPNNSNY